MEGVQAPAAGASAAGAGTAQQPALQGAGLPDAERGFRAGKGVAEAWHTGERKGAEREECAMWRARKSRNCPERAVESEKTDDPPAFESDRTADPLPEMLG